MSPPFPCCLPSEFYRIENRVRTVAAGGERRISFQRIPGSRDAQLFGTIPLRDRGQDLLISVEDPAQFAAQALRTALERAGITVGGNAIAVHQYPAELADLSQAAEPVALNGMELARHVSAPLLEDLRITAKVSQNLHAELALRAVGRARRNVGSFEAGMAEMKDFLAEAGIDPGGYNLMDGSGLSRLDLVTPTTVMKLLRYMYASPLREKWISILPVAAQDGTLSSRFGATPAAGRVYAKTGTLSHVSALSGYLQRPDGGWVAFSILVNNYGDAIGRRSPRRDGSHLQSDIGVDAVQAGAAARARRMPNFSMRACSVLRFNPSVVAAPLRPLITQSAASRAARMWRRSDSSNVSIFWAAAAAGATGWACRSFSGTFRTGPDERMMARSTRFCSSRMLPGQW